jgi:hypothetical protein
VLNTNLREVLVALKEKDDELRGALLSKGTLFDGYDKEMESLHIENAEKLSDIVDEYGWPGRSLAGKDGADAAFMLAQHSISKPALQRKFLEYLRVAAEQGEATYIQVACLEDRILFNEGNSQKYGMIFDWDESGNLFANVDDIGLANERRSKLGLKTIEEATRLHAMEIKLEGGGPPSGFHHRKRLEEEWAKRVGWR